MAKIKDNPNELLTEDRIDKAKGIIGRALSGLRRPRAWVAGSYVRAKVDVAGYKEYEDIGSPGESRYHANKLENLGNTPQYCAMGALFYEGPRDWNDPNLQAATVLIFRQLPKSYLKEAHENHLRYNKKAKTDFNNWLLSVNYKDAHGYIVDFNDLQSRKTPVVNTFQRAYDELN